MWWLGGGNDAQPVTLCGSHPGSHTSPDGDPHPHSDTAAAATHSPAGPGRGSAPSRSAPGRSAAAPSAARLQRR